MTRLERIEVDATEAHRQTVIWLHGLGANGHDFAPLAPIWGNRSTRFVFPHAPEAPVTLNHGFVMPSWYDIRSLERGPDREDPADIDRARTSVRTLIAEEVARGVPEDRIIVGGFSQGGALALYCGLSHPRPLAGIVMLSGYMLNADKLDAFADSAQAQTPVLLCHGTHDPTVPFEGGEDAHKRLRELGRTGDVAFHPFGMGHEVIPAEIQVITEWFGKVFGNTSG